MRPAKSGGRRVLLTNWLLAAVCCHIAWGSDRSAYSPSELARGNERPTPKAWIEEHFGVEFPNTAKHFVLYYRSSDEAVALFCFDISEDDLPRLMDGRGIFPRYGDLAPGGAAAAEGIVRDAASAWFPKRVAAMQNVLSASKRHASPAEPLTVQVWTAEASAGMRQVCVCVSNDGDAGSAAARDGFRMPVTAQDTRSCTIIDSRLDRIDQTGIWQRWTLDESAYCEFLRTARTGGNPVTFSSAAAERLATRLDRRGPAVEAPWWKPSELAESHGNGSKPMEAFSYRDADMTCALILGRAEGLFRCYAFTQRRVLARDPCDAISWLLGLQLPASARGVRYEAVSSMAGIVSWMRFDLPGPDLADCLAQAPRLPAYAQFAVDAVARKHLCTAYQSGAPAWWRPQELSEGLYVQQRNPTKESHDIAAGFGPLSGNILRVYIGEFSAW